MYNFENIHISSYEELMHYVSEEDIMTHYFGEWEPDVHYIDEHFKTEKNPSFYISYYNQQLKWRRFGLFNNPQNPVEFVMHKFGLKYYEALTKIYNDIYLKGNLMPKEQIVRLRSNARDQTNMSIVIKDWEDFDLDYWLQYDGFSIPQLEQFRINAASEYWANERLFHVSNASDPLYCYDHSHETGLNSFTAYRPYGDSPENVAKRKPDYRSLSYKFRKYMIMGHYINLNTLLSRKQSNGIKDSFITNRDPMLSKIVFITSSMKDVVALDCVGIDSIAPHTEEGIITPECLTSLSKHYPHIYIGYNNDSTGVRNSLKLTEHYKDFDLKYWNVPKSCKDCKDPSDVLKNASLDILKEMVFEKLKRDKII